MDYEKLYKEALNKAQKELQCCSDLDCDAARQIFRLFPELAENDDEKIRKELIRYLPYCDDISKDTKERWIAWLKSLKNRCISQLNQEWSEYDKIQLSEAIQMIEANGTWVRSEDSVKKVSNWLKSLKPNHWKPNEYDISLLEEIARNVRNNIRPFCSEVSSLEALIDTLKNL